MKRKLLLGCPGAGKTKTLIERMEELLDRGAHPGEIAFASFTNAAVDEARSRACRRFGLRPDELPYFRTIHSLAFRELGLKRSEVIDEGHLATLGEITGELFTGDPSTEGPASGRNADPLLTLDHYARTTMTSLRQAWEDHGGQIEWFRLLRFSKAYAAFKEETGLVDFTDMLDLYAKSELGPARVKHAIVDEAQDLTIRQWTVVMKAFAAADDLTVAGDDDQSIHRWAGAAEDYLLSLPFDREVLPLSHRLPSVIFDFSQQIVRRIGRRYEKVQGSAKAGGTVEWVSSAEEVDLSSGSWLVLARTKAQLVPLVAVARDQGVVYRVRGQASVKHEDVRAILAHEGLRAGKRVEGPEAALALRAAGVRKEIDEEGTVTAAEIGYDASPIWHDALIRMPIEDREYYLACLRRGSKLTEPPRVRIETIHGAKGLESEHVLLTTDLTHRTHRGYEMDPDSENRVFYVGATRGSVSLHLVAPTGSYGFPM